MTDRTPRFDAEALTYLNAAYNLARWLVRDEHVAEDMVQEAYLRALKYSGSFRGGELRPWLLSIVRNTCHTWLQSNRQRLGDVEFDEERDLGDDGFPAGHGASTPETLLVLKQEGARVNAAIRKLAPVFREVLVLRELEELSYEEIAVVAAIPVGTVMSRLARARALLRVALQDPSGVERP